ncbi:MAG: YMGG-like glycine zipper-containing protein [Nitrosomonas sp.]|nr:YMGG-like glycine zipper-containing protein [Nitrosomonas sp.]
MLTKSKSTILPIALLLSACVSVPTGPSVMTLPGSGKSFDQFRNDDYQCRQFAYEQIGGVTPRQSSLTSGAESAAIGAGLGAAAGALMGGGEGAAIGAGAGLLMGGLTGSDTSRTSGYEGQRRYDISYIQCMYANGHRVPVAGRITEDSYNNRNNSRILTPPQGFTPPPPPPGNPPPPPLR